MRVCAYRADPVRPTPEVAKARRTASGRIEPGGDPAEEIDDAMPDDSGAQGVSKTMKPTGRVFNDPGARIWEVIAGGKDIITPDVRLDRTAREYCIVRQLLVNARRAQHATRLTRLPPHAPHASRASSFLVATKQISTSFRSGLKT